MYKFGSGEGDAYELNKRVKTEYERIMAEKAAQRKVPDAPKNPDTLYIRRRGRV